MTTSFTYINPFLSNSMETFPSNFSLVGFMAGMERVRTGTSFSAFWIKLTVSGANYFILKLNTLL